MKYEGEYMKEKKKEDLVGIALLTMATENYKISEVYTKQLIEHLVKTTGKTEDQVSDSTWQAVLEGDNFKKLMKDIKNSR